jgi:hypothetical protein
LFSDLLLSRSDHEREIEFKEGGSRELRGRKCLGALKLSSAH